ncbi:uncharacterized protein LOC132708190 isoform X2 [Cylas formicarius]|uniref:uncharacterized protein LOC132708190 isoform X2 n=1 Tax=Cylas formicarius TaxID=197179 RepID=UPI0029585991|nr:uncharacterized protein LOC132708190 isoform X2 [Cylas formicarius]
MKFTLVILGALSILSASDGQLLNSSLPPGNYEFVLKLDYVISETKVPSYLVDVLYDSPIENNVTSNDIASLFGLSNLTAASTQNVLAHLGFNTSAVFSLNGFDRLLTEFNWDFADFYRTITGPGHLNASGVALGQALEALGIDVAQFSLGMTLGNPDPYDEFKKGTFTPETLSNATGLINRTTDDLFGAIRDATLPQLLVLNSSQVVDLFSRNSIGRNETVEIWKYINITIEDIYNVEGFRNHLTAVSDNLNVTTLGVATGNGTVTINQRTFDVWRNVSQLIDVRGETLNTSTVVSLSGVATREDSNIVVLASNSSLTPIAPGNPASDLVGCTFLSWQNGALVPLAISNVTFRNNVLEIRNVSENVTLGSPLICGGNVYGIAREIVSDVIVLDTYAAFVSSGGTSPGTNYGVRTVATGGALLLAAVLHALL